MQTLSNPDLWQRYQDWLYFHGQLGLYLDVSRMNFSDGQWSALQPKLANAFQAMTELEAGAIANPDENRMVGHYWLRDPDLAPVAFQNEITGTLGQIESFARKIHQGHLHPPHVARFTDVLSIGIGGSALGPQFVAEALCPDFPPLAIHFIDNTDPAGIDRTLNRLVNRLASTLVIVASKSGGTFETRNGLMEVKQAYAKQGLYFPDYAVAVTLPGSQMDTAERCSDWLATFAMFDWVGGRTSVMASVGLLSAALLGIDIRAMLAGAKAMDRATRVPESKHNPAALLAFCWHHAGNGKGDKDMVLLPYKDSLSLFSRYLQQLVMESLGKALDLDGNTVHQGITVYGNKGSTDQHAFVQQLRDGADNFFVTFIEVLEDRIGPSVEVGPGVTSGDFLTGFLQGTREALYDKGRESITLTVTRVDAQTIGALIALYERAVGLYGALVNINAYDQPGVEAGKKVAASLLALQRAILVVLSTSPEPMAIAQLADAVGAGDQIETVYKIVRHLAANPRGVCLKGNLAKPAELTVCLASQNSYCTVKPHEGE